MLKQLPYLLAAMLCACAGQTVISPITPYMLQSGELYRFVQDAAANHGTVDGVVGGQHVRAVYLGSDGCSRVAVLTLSAKRYVTDIHHYHACRGEVTEYGVGEVPPSYPDSPDARSVLESARRGALLYGEQRVHYQNYAITAHRLGGPDRHCMPVETIITNRGLIVLEDTSTTCR